MGWTLVAGEGPRARPPPRLRGKGRAVVVSSCWPRPGAWRGEEASGSRASSGRSRLQPKRERLPGVGGRVPRDSPSPCGQRPLGRPCGAGAGSPDLCVGPGPLLSTWGDTPAASPKLTAVTWLRTPAASLDGPQSRGSVPRSQARQAQRALRRPSGRRALGTPAPERAGLSREVAARRGPGGPPLGRGSSRGEREGPPESSAVPRQHRTLQNLVSPLRTGRGKSPSTSRTKWAATRPPGHTQLRSRPSLRPTWSQGRPRGCPARPLPTPGTRAPRPGLRQLSGAGCSSGREEGGTLPATRRGPRRTRRRRGGGQSCPAARCRTEGAAGQGQSHSPSGPRPLWPQAILRFPGQHLEDQGAPQTGTRPEGSSRWATADQTTRKGGLRAADSGGGEGGRGRRRGRGRVCSYLVRKLRGSNQG